MFQMGGVKIVREGVFFHHHFGRICVTACVTMAKTHQKGSSATKASQKVNHTEETQWPTEDQEPNQEEDTRAAPCIPWNGKIFCSGSWICVRKYNCGQSWLKSLADNGITMPRVDFSQKAIFLFFEMHRNLSNLPADRQPINVKNSTVTAPVAKAS